MRKRALFSAPLVTLLLLLWTAAASSAHQPRTPQAAEPGLSIEKPIHTATLDRSCAWYNYACNITYVWPIPDEFGDDFFNQRFTPPACCTLTAVEFLFYDNYPEFSNVSGSGVDIYVWDSDGFGYPNTVVAGPINVLGSDILFYPDATHISLADYALIFCSDFHVGYSVVDQAADNIALLSDDATCGQQRSSESWSGIWGLMLDDWGYDVNFLIYAEICCPDACYATGDCDGDGIGLAVADLVYLIDYLTGDGPPPDPLYEADMNGDCVVDTADANLYSRYFTEGIGVFDPYGGYPVLTCCDIFGPVSNLSFEQQDFLDEDGVVVAGNSDWGRVSFDVVPFASGPVQYLNITAEADGEVGWIVRNFAILPGDLMAEDRYGLDFDLNEIGVANGQDISSLSYGAEVTTTLQEDPNLPRTHTAAVTQAIVQEFGAIVEEGGSGFTGPGILIPPYVYNVVNADSVRKYRGLTDYSAVPPVQEGTNECCSGATARSLKWLSNEHSLGLGSAQSIQERLDDADLMDQGATGKQVAEAKKAYIEENNLPLEVHWWNSDNYYNGHDSWRNTPGIPSESSGDIDFKEWLKREMDKGQDIELFIKWGSGGAHLVTLVGLDPANNTVEYRDDEMQGDGLISQLLGDLWVKEAALVPLGGGEYGFRAAGNRIISAHAESPKSFDVGWRYHPRYVDGWLTVYGTINCQTYDPPLFERAYVESCHTYTGDIPDWANDYLIIFEWDWWCGNVDSIKVARPVWDYDLWHWLLQPLQQYLGQNLPTEGTILPCVGDEYGEFQQIHTMVNIEEWLADPRPLQEEYYVVNGTCPDLPGYLIGTTRIMFDPLAGPTDNPFSTTPYTGPLHLDADLVLAVAPEFITGDANGDGIVNITDAVYLIGYIFNSGPAPDPLESGDANCDGLTNITDAVYLIQYIFGGGPPPGDPNDDGIPDC